MSEVVSRGTTSRKVGNHAAMVVSEILFPLFLFCLHATEGRFLCCSWEELALRLGACARIMEARVRERLKSDP